MLFLFLELFSIRLQIRYRFKRGEIEIADLRKKIRKALIQKSLIPHSLNRKFKLSTSSSPGLKLSTPPGVDSFKGLNPISLFQATI